MFHVSECDHKNRIFRTLRKVMSPLLYQKNLNVKTVRQVLFDCFIFLPLLKIGSASQTLALGFQAIINIPAYVLLARSLKKQRTLTCSTLQARVAVLHLVTSQFVAYIVNIESLHLNAVNAIELSFSLGKQLDLEPSIELCLSLNS